MTEEEKKIAEWFFNLVGYFNHYSFFTQKQWRSIEGFDHKDEAEVKCAFMHYWFHHKFGYYTAPVGISWFSEVSERSYNEYVDEYKLVFEAFEDWKYQQR